MTCRPCIRTLPVIGLLLLLTEIGTAGSVGVQIDAERDADLAVIDATHGDGTHTWLVEAENTGSVPFVGQLRLDITDAANRTVFRTWSDTVRLQPGAAHGTTLSAALPAHATNLSARLVLDRGVHRTTVTDTFTATNTSTTADGVAVDRAWADDEAVHLLVATPAAVDRFTVTARSHEALWFAQQQAERTGALTQVTVPYHPPFTDPTDVSITVHSADGTYYRTAAMTVTPVTGIREQVKQLVDRVLTHPLVLRL